MVFDTLVMSMNFIEFNGKHKLNNENQNYFMPSSIII